MTVFDVLYSLCSHQHVLATTVAIFKVILLIKEYKGTNEVSCVAVTFFVLFVLFYSFIL